MYCDTVNSSLRFRVFWISTLNFREFGELISMVVLPTTPLVIILSVFMGTVIYILFLGYEVLARLAEIMFPVILFFIITTYVLLIFSGEVDFGRLQPVLGNGIKPVLKATFPALINFPFGEMVVFLMYWNYVNDKQSVRKISFFVTGATGLLLALLLVFIVSVLEVPYAKNSTIPIYELVKLINISDIITNLDAIATVLQFIGGFFKMILHFYGGVLVIKTLFRIKNDKLLIVIFGVFWLIFSLTYYENLIFHRWTGLKESISYFYSGFTVMEIACPLLILGNIWIKNRKNKLIQKF